MTSSIGTKSRVSLSRTNRGSASLTLSTFRCSRSVRGSRTTTASDRRRSSMWGNGWPGALVIALGVSTGNTCSSKYALSWARSLSPSPVQARIRTPFRVSSPSHSLAKQRYWRRNSARSRGFIAWSSSRGLRPSMDRRVRPAATACFRPPTLVMKNSSRLVVKMARKRSRASRGVAASSASASTRALNSSQLSSGVITGSKPARCHHAGQAEREGHAVPNDEHDAGHHQRQDDHRVGYALVVLHILFGEHVDPGDRDRKHQGAHDAEHGPQRAHGRPSPAGALPDGGGKLVQVRHQAKRGRREVDPQRPARVY